MFLSVVIAACGQNSSKSDITDKSGADSIVPEKTTVQAKQDTTPPGNGIYEKKYANGQVSLRGEMRNGKREGVWVSYYENGQLWSQNEYVNGMRQGKTVTWYPNGQKRFEGSYTNDKQTGTWKFWEENGKLAKEVNYDKPAGQ